MTERKVVFVAGAASEENVGKAIARKFKEEGYVVVIGDIKPNEDDPGAYFDHYLNIDVTEEMQIKMALEGIMLEYGRLDAIVNSAGVNILGKIEDYAVENLYDTLSVNLVSNFLLLKHYVKIFDNNGMHKVFLVIGSDTAEIPKTSTFAYGASKAGVHHFVRCAARELNKYHKDSWLVTALGIGMVEGTPMDNRTIADLVDQRGCTEEAARAMLTANIPIGRGMTTSEVAEYAYFVATKGEYLTGNIIRIDAGQCQG